MDMPWLLHKFCVLSQAKGLGCQLWKWFCPLGSKDTWHPSHVACNIEDAQNTSHRFLTMLSKKDMPYAKPQDVFHWVGGSKFCFLLGRAIVLAMDFFLSADLRDLKWIFQTGHPLLQMQFFSVVGLWVRVFFWLKNPLNAMRSSASKERGNLCDRAPTPWAGSFSRGAVKILKCLKWWRNGSPQDFRNCKTNNSVEFVVEWTVQFRRYVLVETGHFIGSHNCSF